MAPIFLSVPHLLFSIDKLFSLHVSMMNKLLIRCIYQVLQSSENNQSNFYHDNQIGDRKFYFRP